MSAGTIGAGDYHLDIAKGLVPLELGITLVGNNTAAGNTAETIWPPGGRYIFPATADTVDVSSDDAGDAAAGVGLQTVQLGGLDANYLFITELITLNGVTPVTSTLSFLRINEVVAKSAGTNKTASGNITADHTTSGDTLGYIALGDNISRQAVFTVPAGTALYLEKVKAEGGLNDEFTFNMIAYNFGEDIPITVIADYVYQSSVPSPFIVPKKFEEKTDIELTATNTGPGGNSKASTFAQFILVIEPV